MLCGNAALPFLKESQNSQNFFFKYETSNIKILFTFGLSES